MWLKRKSLFTAGNPGLRPGDLERLKCTEQWFVQGRPNTAAAARLGISEQAVANHQPFVVSKLKDAGRLARVQNFDLTAMGIVE
mgnify:CR=1 FL=1